MKTDTILFSMLAAGATIQGDVILDHGITLLGMVTGSVVATPGLLHVGPGGIVKGQVDGEHVRIDGTVEGDVHARGTLEINGRVKGRIFYCGTIRLGTRASLDGSVSRVPRERTIEAPSTPVQQLQDQTSA